MAAPLRVSYQKARGLVRAGIGSVRLETEQIVLTLDSGEEISFPKTSTDIGVGGGGQVSTGTNPTFVLTNRLNKKIAYRVTFIGTSGPGFEKLRGNDWQENQRAFVKYVAAIQGSDSNFKPDGTYQAAWKHLDKKARKITILIIVGCTIALIFLLVVMLTD